MVNRLSKEEKDGLRCNSIKTGTYVVYHEQVRRVQQGNEVKTNISKNEDLVYVEGLLQTPENFGNKKSGIDGLKAEIRNVFQKSLFRF